MRVTDAYIGSHFLRHRPSWWMSKSCVSFRENWRMVVNIHAQMEGTRWHWRQPGPDLEADALHGADSRQGRDPGYDCAPAG